MYCLLTTHPPTVFHPYIDTILQPVIVAVGDPFYKITAEALGVLQELIKVIRPLQVSYIFFTVCPKLVLLVLGLSRLNEGSSKVKLISDFLIEFFIFINFQYCWTPL